MAEAAAHAAAVLLVLCPGLITTRTADARGGAAPAAPQVDPTKGRAYFDQAVNWVNDGKPGIRGIDDDGAGLVDDSFSPLADDDESADFSQNEDPLNGIDDDGDGIVDEDPGADTNGDGCADICAVDDDADGSLDEGAAADDDEDGSVDEDWLDPVVFYLSGDTLMHRTPVPWDESGNGSVSGQDFISSAIADNVTRLLIERLPLTAAGVQLVDLTLELTSPDSGEMVSLNTRVRVGGAL